MLLPSGSPIKCHEELSWQPMFPSKRFDNFDNNNSRPPLIGWMLYYIDINIDMKRRFRWVHFFLYTTKFYAPSLLYFYTRGMLDLGYSSYK